MEIKTKIRGFTLIEIIFYISLFSIISLTMTLFFGEVMKMRQKSLAINIVETEGNKIMNTLIETVKSSKLINTPALGYSLDSFSVQRSDLTLNPTIVSYVNSNILIKEGINSTIQLNSNLVEVTDLIVKNLSQQNSNGNLSISFTLKYKNPDNKIELNYINTFQSSVTKRF